MFSVVVSVKHEGDLIDLECECTFLDYYTMAENINRR